MGERLRDRYDVEDVLGVGGEGRVLRARDKRLDRVVALKVRRVPNRRTRSAALDEVRTLLAVPPHPGIAQLHDHFFEGRNHVVVMEHIDGSDLATVLARDGRPGLPHNEVATWIGRMADALDHLHRCLPPIVHGDVKPANIVLSERGPVLVDFGVAGSGRGSGATRRYAAPEQAQGQRSPASDVFSLAVTAYELLTGSTPAPGEPPAWTTVPEANWRAVAAVFVGPLSFDPRQRPGVRSFATSLASALDPDGCTDPAAVAAAPALHPSLLSTTVLNLPHRRRRMHVLGAAAAFVLASGVASAATLAEGDDRRGRDEVLTVVPSTTSTTPAPASTALPSTGSPSSTVPGGPLATVVDVVAPSEAATGSVDDTGPVDTVRSAVVAGGPVVDRMVFYEQGRLHSVDIHQNTGVEEVATLVGLRRWTDVATLNDGRVLWFDHESNDTEVSLINPDGTMVDEISYPYMGQSWSHLIYLGNGLLLYYRQDTGYGSSAIFEDGRMVDNDIYGGVIPAGYDQVARSGLAFAVLYRSRDGLMSVFRVANDGAGSMTGDVQMPSGWTVMGTAIGAGPDGTDLVVGLDGDGNGKVVRSTFSNDGIGRVEELGDVSIPGHWTRAESYGEGVVLYDPLAGSGVVVRFGPNGTVLASSTITFPAGAVLARLL